MAELTLEKQLLEQIRRLNPEQKRKVLDFARELSEMNQPRGTPAAEFSASAAAVDFDPADLQEIAQAIEEDCEQIDPDGWQ